MTFTAAEHRENFTIKDRKVTHWRDYLDPVAVFNAVGWPPSSPSAMTWKNGPSTSNPGRDACQLAVMNSPTASGRLTIRTSPTQP